MAESSTSEACAARAVRDEIVDAVLAAVPERAKADAVVEVIAEALTVPALADRLVGLAAQAQSVAWAAWNLRDDLYENPTTPETAARIVIATLAAAIGQVPQACSLSRAEAERAVAEVEYRDWRFEIDEQPTGLGVRVVATLDDTRRRSGAFTLSRSAPIRGIDVAGAALAAVLQVEEHEAMERLRYRGERPFDPHAAPAPFVAETALHRP